MACYRIAGSGPFRFVREPRAKVTNATGEHEAARALHDASRILSGQQGVGAVGT